LFTGVVDTGNKFIASTVITSDNYSPSVVDTGEKFIIGVVVTGDNFSVVSTTPMINLLPVLMTPPIKENP
jgi:hypothetical protein